MSVRIIMPVRISSVSMRAAMRGFAVAAIAILAVAAVGARAIAQTSPTKPARKLDADSFATPEAAKKAKKDLTKPATLCSIYGDGFVNVPGTDTCVKIGGSVRYETGGRR
jgi:hypothetical protein